MKLCRRASIVVLTTALVLAVVPGASGAAGARSPEALLSALVKAPVGKTALPHGYRSPVVSTYQVSATAKKNHAIGGVQIVADGGNEAVIYLVFATAADAKRDWAKANFAGNHTTPTPKSMPQPSLIIEATTTGTSKGKTIKVGLTDVGCLQGNVIVQGITSSIKNTRQGDTPGALALELYALKHLKSVQ